ncbi:MAG: YraN family protein [Gammaproteobacteria bacterium RIFCSPHIGHO2_12_FULL_37_14]|nr:MAG: YraN family protein [Gammaproteobacteria bacterium RIFCSPHIGHO2_12_FULL_37_14]
MQNYPKWDNGVTHSTSHLEFGKSAELVACQFLLKKGLRLLTTNYRCYYGEIDIIMQDSDDIVFVEVRGRGSNKYGSALESINKSKIKKIIKTATHFLQRKKLLYQVTSRFDVVAINQLASKWDIDWIKNAFWEEV